eukprot:13087943-Alexandrium_andersonii.AAC.1
MSASLVGSEMCIRDSPRTPFWGSIWTAIRSGRGNDCNDDGDDARDGHICCLLYTSDAADDM